MRNTVTVSSPRWFW